MTRPTGADLMAMTDETFGAFIDASGLKTVTTADLTPVDYAGWVPYDGVYPLREEGWLMAPDKPIDDLEDDAPDVPNDEVTVETTTTITTPSENDDDQEKEK